MWEPMLPLPELIAKIRIIALKIEHHVRRLLGDWEGLE